VWARSASLPVEPEAIVIGMASVAPVTDSAPVPPPADPQTIRACLPLVAEFDGEWRIVLERVKQSEDLADLHELLNKWRHTAYARCATLALTTGC
jgi:hypothetical protein